MKKQGFTLIELMVVVVIIGILAAVAVPKLFGMIAKSKASEVGPAAGEYVKLQDAFVAEKGTFTGTWQQIGYKMFNSSNFTYKEGTAASCEAGAADCKGYPTVTARDEKSAYAETNAWVAANKATLNDCTAGDHWTISTEANGETGGTVLYAVTIADDADGSCEALTPSFKQLNTKAQ